MSEELFAMESVAGVGVGGGSGSADVGCEALCGGAAEAGKV